MTVYIIQNQKTIDRATGQLRDKFDFEPAKEFGEIVYLLSPSARPFNLKTIVEELHFKLRGFGDGDFLLLTGSPVFIGLAVAIAADFNGGNVTMLQWSGAKRTYYPIHGLDIFPDHSQEDGE